MPDRQEARSSTQSAWKQERSQVHGPIRKISLHKGYFSHFERLFPRIIFLFMSGRGKRYATMKAFYE